MQELTSNDSHHESQNKSKELLISNLLAISEQKAAIACLLWTMSELYLTQNEGMNADRLEDYHAQMHHLRQVILNC